MLYYIEVILICIELKDVTGVVRLTRHPIFWAVSIFAMGKVITNPHMFDTLFWSAVPVAALSLGLYQDFQQKEILPKRYYQDTSFLPLVNICNGSQSLVNAAEEWDLKAFIVGYFIPLTAKLWPMKKWSQRFYNRTGF